MNEMKLRERANADEYRAFNELCGDARAFNLRCLLLASIQTGACTARFDSSFAEYLNMFKIPNTRDGIQEIIQKNRSVEADSRIPEVDSRIFRKTAVCIVNDGDVRVRRCWKSDGIRDISTIKIGKTHCNASTMAYNSVR